MCFAEYVTSIAKRCSDSENSEEERVSALCALLANFFVIHITHLTTIMRIGAKVIVHHLLWSLARLAQCEVALLYD